MREGQIFSGLQDRRDVGIVDARRQLIGRQDHDDVGFLRCVPDRQHAQPDLLRLGDGCAGGLEADDNVAARIRQIHGVGVALRTEADHGYFLVLDVVKIRVLIVINLHSSSCCVLNVSNFNSERNNLRTRSTGFSLCPSSIFLCKEHTG